MSEKRSVTIKIRDQVISITTDASEERLQKLSTLLTEEMESILQKMKSPNPNHAALLTALKLADQLLEIQEKKDSFQKQVTERSQKILDLLDSVNDSAN